MIETAQRIILQQANDYLFETYPVLWLGINYHRTHQNKQIDFSKHKYLIKLYKDNADNLCVIKSTQCGLSEFLIIRVAYLSMKGRNVLYVLPTEQIRNRFVATRVNRSIALTEQYRFNNKANKSAGLKEIGSGLINFVGSNAESVFTEFVAHDVIIDELDQCNLDNTYMSSERQSSIADKTQMLVSNPTILDYGIDEEFKKSDQKMWMIKCDSCNNELYPDFFKHIVKEISPNEYVIRDEAWEENTTKDINLICDKCNKPIDRFKDGKWIAKNPSSLISGYHISKLFSTEVKVTEIVSRFNEGLLSDRKLQRFYNADLGQAFTASGAKITTDMLNDCIHDFGMVESCSDPCLIGIDVGTLLSVIIGKLIHTETGMKIALIYIKELQTEYDIIELFQRFNIRCGVIDSKPEIRTTRRLLQTLKPLWSCEYLTESTHDSIDPDRKMIKTDRTMSLDGVKEHIVLQQIMLPANAKTIDKFYDQMIASTRVWKDLPHSITGGRYIWIEGSKRDDFFHSLNYLLIAKKLLFMLK